MRALQVTFDALGAQHTAAKWKFLPGLETDDFVVLDLELDATLLPAEATMRLHESIGVDAAVQALATGKCQVRPERINN